MRIPTRTARMTPALIVLSAASFGASAQVVQPERVGLSSERLERIGDVMDRHIAAGGFSGAVTLADLHSRRVARLRDGRDAGRHRLAANLGTGRLL